MTAMGFVVTAALDRDLADKWKTDEQPDIMRLSGTGCIWAEFLFTH